MRLVVIVRGMHADCVRSVMFNTNDIVRWREDGSLETFGRGDDQVKIKVRRATSHSAHLLTSHRVSASNWMVCPPRSRNTMAFRGLPR